MTLDDDLTEEQLAKLAEEGTDEEKRAVARHPNTSLQTLHYLSQICFADEVDKNLLLPLYVEAGSDEVVKILDNIAVQTERGERLNELASSVWDNVRYSVAINKNTNPDTLASLAKDKEDVRIKVAENQNTPPATLSFLATDEKNYVRSNVARNERTPPNTLRLLAEDKADSVRFSVANNKLTPYDKLEILAKDVNMQVRQAANSTLAKLKKVPQ